MDVKLRDGVLLTFDVQRNQPVILKVTPDNNVTPVDSYRANSLLGIASRDSAALQSLKDFMVTHNIPEDAEGSIDSSDGYPDDDVARTCLGLIAVMYPVFSQLFKSESYSDGFYGTTPLMSPKIVEACRAPTLNDFIIILFGEYRKDLARAVMSSNSCSTVFLTSLFASHMPTEWLVDAIRKGGCGGIQWMDVDDNKMNRMLSFMDRFTNRRLMKALLNSDTYEEMMSFVEASRFLHHIPDAQVSLPAEVISANLHYHFLRLSKGLEVDGVFEIPPILESLHQAEVNGFQSVVLRSTAEYSDTGRAMENCAGNVSYSIDSMEGRSFLVRFDVDEKPKYLMELSSMMGSWKVNQLLGRKNTPVPEEDKEAILSLVKEKVGKK